ncbi:phage tail protein, partial [Microbispora rosea]
VKELPGKIKDKLGDLGELLTDSGKDIVTGLWSGIQSLGGWLQGKVTSFFGSLVPDWVKKAIDAHSPSRVFATIGGYVTQGFAQGILQEAPRAQMTAKQFAKMIKDAMSVDLKGAPDAFVEWVRTNNSQLKDLADKRAEIIKTIADAKKYADQIAQQMQDFASVANLGLGEGDGAGDIVSGLQTKLDQIKKFANDIKKLAESGLNKTTLAQIINAGPEKGLSLAEMLVGADGSEIKAINKAQSQIDKVSKQMGKNSADALYDVGKQAGDGFLKGLQGKLKETESMMAQIAKAVVAAAKKELNSHSPSRVFMGIGGDTLDGYILGLRARQDATTATMSGVIGKAVSVASRVPGLVPGAMAGPTAAPAYGGEYGQGHGQVYGAGPGGVVVHMPNAVVREQADIGRIGAEFAFKYRARG